MKVPKGREKPQVFQQKMSFLGTLSNRTDNLRKLAKHNSARLNTVYEEQKNSEKRKVMSSANSSVYNSANVSKRNIVHRRPYIPQPSKALTNASQHNISNNQQNASIGSAAAGTPIRGKDFVIKQKVKREYTNENENQT